MNDINFFKEVIILSIFNESVYYFNEVFVKDVIKNREDIKDLNVINL